MLLLKQWPYLSVFPRYISISFPLCEAFKILIQLVPFLSLETKYIGSAGDGKSSEVPIISINRLDFVGI